MVVVADDGHAEALGDHSDVDQAVGGCARRVLFGSGPEAELSERAGYLWWDERPLLAVEEISLPGAHNRQNAMATAGWWGSPAYLPLDHPMAQRLQFWLDQMDAQLRATQLASLASEVAARISEKCFFELESPVLRVCGFSTPYPTSRIEEDYLPDLDRILDAVDRSLAF